MSKRSGKSLAQSQRDALMETVGRRGRKTANVWLLKEPLTGKDVVVVGDLRMEHFFAIEGDPEVAKAVYNPKPVEVTDQSVQFDAVIDFRDGHRECRQVRRAVVVEDVPESVAMAAERLGGRHVVVTPRDLDVHRQRVQNWQRALAAVSRCGHRSLELLEFEILALVGPGQSTTIGDLCEALTQDPALLVAATVRLVRKHALSSDLDHKPWSRNTRIAQEHAA